MSMPILPFALPGFVVEGVCTAVTTLLSDARATTLTVSCPDCHQPTTRVHSRSTRQVRDLPVVESPVRLRLHVRRFRCTHPPCARRTFAERLPELAPFRAQRTMRLTHAIRGLGGALGGEAGARMATRLRFSRLQVGRADHAVTEGKPLNPSRPGCHSHGITKSGQE